MLEPSRQARSISDFALILAACAVFTILGCDDDPSAPSNDDTAKWSEVQLPADLPDGQLSAAAFHTDRAIAVGTTRNVRVFLLEKDADAWERVDVGDVAGALDAVAFTPDGKAVGVGSTSSFHPMVLDERESWMPRQISTSLARQTHAAVGVDGHIRTIGFGPSVRAFRSDGAGVWETEDVEFPGDPGDKGLLDLIVGSGGALYACGFDDGGDGSAEQPFRMIMSNSSEAWELFAPLPENAAHLEFDDAGGFTCAGERFQMGGSPVAVLWSRDADENWVEIELPDAVGFEVADLLAAPDGAIYVAGARLEAESVGGRPVKTGILWRWDGHVARKETTFPEREPLRLAQDAQAVYITGADFRSGAVRPWMARRALD